jgi:hypothetical protein
VTHMSCRSWGQGSRRDIALVIRVPNPTWSLLLSGSELK